MLTPLLWERFSRVFRVEDEARERAHGDGMMVSADSPEALEEVVWLAFWRAHYRPDRIVPWRAEEESPEFLEFFQSHVRKLVAATRPAATSPARTGTAPDTPRYISKNNLNIARLAWLARAFPDARFVVPFRDPLQHAASLLRQHRNFTALHDRDAFARRYMAGVGHFDFGANLRPVDFDGWFDPERAGPPTRLAFWVRYWTAAYRHLATLAGDRVRLVDYDALCTTPDTSLGELADFLGIEDRAALLAQGARLRAPRPHPVDVSSLDPDTFAAARAVHDQLRETGAPQRREFKLKVEV